MAQFLYRVGCFAARRRWAVLATWVVALIAIGVAALGLSGSMSSSFSIPGTSAQKSMDQLAEKMPAAAGASGQLVFSVEKGESITDPQYQQAMSQTLAAVSEIPDVVNVADPVTTGAISPDGRVAMAQITFQGQMTEVPEAVPAAIQQISVDHQIAGLTIDRSGAAVEQVPAIGSTEGLGVIIALVVLLVTFGSVVAAGLPLLTALIGVGVGMAGILTVSGFVDMSSTAPILALMLGLAVGIDYALFIVNRHRQQLRDGVDIDESIGRAVGTAGSAVVFAGLTVVIALAALAVVGIPFLTIMGIAAAATVAIAVLIAITLVPALLRFAGPKVLPRKHRGAAAIAVDADADSDDRPQKTNRWSALVTKRPVAMSIASIVLLGILAVPAFSLRMGLPSDGAAPANSTQRHAYDKIAESFGPGANGPLIVTVATDNPADLQTALGATATKISELDDVLLARPAGASPDGSIGIVQVVPGTGPSDDATEDLVHAIRDAAAGLDQQFGVQVGVTGQTAMNIDVSEKLAAALPVYLVIVIGLALILLLMVFRSIVVPLKAAIGFLLTIAVSFGGVVAIYQWGWLRAIFGVDTPAPIISFLPILLVGILFGLAMDYEVFLVSGMREAWVHRHSSGDTATQTVQHGFSAGARVVTAAAIIMASVFGGFVMAPDTIIASIGFALAFGVLIDAFVVRMTLVPAVMTLLGKYAWYLPRWLERVLPNVDIEGASLRHGEVDAAPLQDA